MTMKAIPYLRWSSAKQSDGSSDARQRETLERFCSEEGWPIEQWLTDDGVSAWTGANVRVGALGDFLARVEVEGGHGLVLVVETQDRLSRMNELDFFEWFLPILRTGLTVAFSDNGMIVDQVSIRNQKRQMRKIFDGQEEANAYVEKLSNRVRAAWQKMRDEGKPVHCASTVPGWLEIEYGPRNSRVGFKVRHDKVAVLERIFRAYVAGTGINAIAKQLNAEKVPTFRRGRCWHPSTVGALLRNRAVIGEYQHKSRRSDIAAIGDPVPDYFPAVISDELFQKANDPRVRKIQSQRSQGDKYRNLLSNLAHCHECLGRMTFIERSARKGAAYEAYLVCGSYHLKTGCNQRRRIRYDSVEKVVLDSLLMAALDDVHFQNSSDVTAISMRLASERRALQDIGRKLDNIARALETDADDGRLLGRYSALKADEHVAEKIVRTSEAELNAAKGATSTKEHVIRVAELRRELYHFDHERRLRARRVVKLALNDLIASFSLRGGKQDVRWPHRTHYRHPKGVPADLQYVPTETQDGIIVLRGGVRFIHVDLNGGGVIFDGSTGEKRNDPILKDYYRRMDRLPMPKSDAEWLAVYTALEAKRV
jgi:DNA invertase Pin-like site-specific DNA recombinase